MKPLISVIIPAYNEADNIPELGKRLKTVFSHNRRYNFEVIIVDNGSTDKTFIRLNALRHQDKRFKIVQLSRNFTCDGGIAAGLAHAQGTAAVIMMADLQDPPEMITQFISKWEQGYDIIYGVIKKRQGTSWLRNFNSILFYKIVNFLTQGVFPENVSDFRLIDKKVYQAINSMPEHNQFLRGMIMWTGFTHTGIKFNRPPRFAGESKARFFTVLTVALNGIFAFSYFPLKLVTVSGIILSLMSFAMIIRQLVLFALYGRGQPGQTTLVILISFLFGMLFLILGVIGEYLARIYDEVKRRPTFIVKQTLGI